MNIFDEHGTLVGEIEKPGPVKQDGVWYETTGLRNPKKRELTIPIYSEFDECLIRPVIKDTKKPCWIMSLIPRATPKQLKAIGMRERDDRPVECKSGDKIWRGDRCVTYYSGFGPMCRWVLEDVPREKSFCEGCTTNKIFCPIGNDFKSNIIDCEKKNYAPPVPSAEKKLWRTGHYDRLFDYMEKNHHVLLFDSEMNEICRIVREMDENKEKEPAHTSCELHNCAKRHDCPHLGCPKGNCYVSAPAPAPKVTDAPKYNAFDNRAIGWDKVIRACVKLGFDIYNDSKSRIKADDRLCAFIRSLAQRVGENEEKGKYFMEIEHLYYELLYAVGNIFPNESRHQTALKYIRQAEQPSEIGSVTTRADTRPDRGMESR